jgi:hypothetical protein
MLDAGRKIRDARCVMLDSGYRMLDAGCMIRGDAVWWGEPVFFQRWDTLKVSYILSPT